MDHRSFRSRRARSITACALAVSVVAAGSPARAVGPVNVGFDTPVTLETGSDVYATTIADVTGDGLADLIAGNTGVVSDTADFTLQVFVQQPGGTLAEPPVAYTPTKLVGDEPSLVTAPGDLDHDGDTDIAASTAQGLDVFLQSGGVLTGPTSYASPAGEVFDVQVADLNADGRVDVVYTVAVAASPGDYRVVRRYQNATGTFDAAAVLGTYAAGARVAVGDVTGDGQPDVVVGDGSVDGLHVQVQEDDLSFTPQTDPRLTQVEIALFADVTGDGLDDLVALDGSPSPLRVMAAVAGGGLADPVSYATTDAPPDLSIEAADLNGDGTIDLAVFSDSRTTVYLQDDAGSLSGPCLAPALMTPSAVGGAEVTAVGDLDGDGVSDFAGGGGLPGASVMTGFAAGETYPTSLSLGAMAPEIKVGGTVELSGELERSYGCLEAGAKVAIWRATDGAASVKIGTAPIEETVDGFTFTFQDTPAVAGRYAYRAVFAGGDVQDGSQSVPVMVDVVQRMASVTLGVSDANLRFGQSTRLTATLKGPDTGRVAFYADVDGRSRLLDSVKVSARGKAMLEVRPKVNTRYTARYVGTATYVSAVSREKAVKVTAIVNGVMVKYQKKVKGTAIYECCRAWFLTWVEPKKPGQQVKVTVQYWNGRGWKNLVADKDLFKLNAEGAAMIYLDIAGGGGFRFRARSTWSTDGLNVGASSPWAPFKLVV